MVDRVNFTKSNIASLQPPTGGRDEYADTKISGLRVRVSASGIKTFSLYRRTRGGSPERVTLGRFPDMSVEQARKRAQILIASIVDGANPAEMRRSFRAEPDFDYLFQQYYERHALPNKKSAKNDRQRYETYLASTLGRMKVSSISRAMITGIHSDITKKGHPEVANRVIALISSVYSRAIEWELVSESPALRIKKNRETSRDRFLQSDELPRFFKSLDEETNVTARDFFYLCLYTGARRANVLAMKWSEVNFEEKLWRIPDTKNGTPHNVPLVDQAMEILIRRREGRGGEYVLPGDGSSGHYAEPRKAWVRVLERAGLSDLRIHDLRRTLGSWQAKTGASLTVIGKSLNHKSHQTTTIYARLDVDPVRDAMGKAVKAIVDRTTPSTPHPEDAT